MVDLTISRLDSILVSERLTEIQNFNFLLYFLFNVGKSASSFCRQVAEKISTDFESLEFLELLYVCLTKKIKFYSINQITDFYQKLK
jgi:hypothetical protein